MTPEEPTNYSGLRPPHPNDLDRKRIARALMARKRYRYVTPDVLGLTEVTGLRAHAAPGISMRKAARSISLLSNFRKDHADGGFTVKIMTEEYGSFIALMTGLLILWTG